VPAATMSVSAWMPRSVFTVVSRKLRRLPIAWLATTSSSGPQGARGRVAAAGAAASAACGAGGVQRMEQQPAPVLVQAQVALAWALARVPPRSSARPVG